MKKLLKFFTKIKNSLRFFTTENSWTPLSLVQNAKGTRLNPRPFLRTIEEAFFEVVGNVNVAFILTHAQLCGFKCNVFMT